MLCGYQSHIRKMKTEIRKRGTWIQLRGNELANSLTPEKRDVNSKATDSLTTTKTSHGVEMKPVKFREFVSASDLNCKNREEYLNTCGSCQSCAFATKLSESSQWLRQATDECKRRLLVGLLLRCRSVRVLESIQTVLQVTSWKGFTYARSNRPSLTQDTVSCSPDRALNGNLLGMEMVETWDWFSSSPDWIKSKYLFRVLSLCDTELLRMLGNLTSVLLVREKRAFLQFNARSSQHNAPSELESVGLRGLSRRRGECGGSEADSEDPALMVVPGSSSSMSGVSRYRDFIRCLPVHLSKRILGLLDKYTLRCCRKVSLHWRYLAQETMEDMDAKRIFQDQVVMMESNRTNRVCPTYANILEVLVPIKYDEGGDLHSGDQKDKPFEAAYANIKTKTVEMEERNVYCGVYNVMVLLEKEDPHRVVDYGGGQLVAVGSKDCMVRLLYVASAKEAAPVMKGHVGSIRAVLLCEDRGLLISGGYDFSIRCWNLRTAACVMVLYGHTGTINCLDVHDDRLVSGAKDCKVKVWNLQTGKCFEDFNFKHPSSVRCVKMNATVVYSSCDKGLVKIWDMESASLLKVIDAHRSSVKCLFFDRWHLLSGDSDGQAMAWSTSCDAEECLMTFTHPKEVQSLTLTYLRVVTGCMDGKIRIFNFLTGDCLRIIRAGVKPSPILSMHFHDSSILVNTTSSVQLYQFAKVCWDYTVSAEGGQRGAAMAQAGLASEKSSASLRKFPRAFVPADRMAQVASANRKIYDCNRKKPQRAELSRHTRSLSAPTKCRAQAKEFSETTKSSVTQSEKAASERVRKRGLHHPLMTEHILLRVNTIQKALCKDEAGVNMERNARLRDAWSSPPPSPLQDEHPKPRSSQALKRSLQTQKRPLLHKVFTGMTKTSVPVLTRAISQNMRNTFQSREVTLATMRPHTHPGDCLTELHPRSVGEKTPPHSAGTQEAFRKVGAFTTSAKEGPQAPERMFMRAIPEHPGGYVKFETTGSPAPKSKPMDPFRERGGFRLLTETQLKEYVRAQRERMQNSKQKTSKKD
ncbi:F-box and WD repeat domain containing protein 10B [Centroberyx gerrardi]